MGNAFDTKDHARTPSKAPNDPQSSGHEADASTGSKTRPGMETTRLTRLPAVFEVGEQVFGTDHIFVLPVMFNVAAGKGSAQLRTSIDGSDAFRVANAPPVLAESGRMSPGTLDAALQRPLSVRFAPPLEREAPSQHYSATLTVAATWDDGHVETQRVRLHARARQTNEVPQTHVAKGGEHQAPEATTAPGTYPSDSRFEAAAGAAEHAAKGVADSQRDGLSALIDQCRAYNAPSPAPSSSWWDLVEIAVKLGTSVVGGALARTLTVELAESVLGSPSPTAAVGMPRAGATIGLPRSAGPNATVEQIVYQMKTGMTSAATAALANVNPSEQSRQPEDLKDLAFFDAQRTALTELAQQNVGLVAAQKASLGPMLASDPQTAILSMRAISSALGGSRPTAKRAQQQATAVEWIAYKARVANGVAQTPTKETVTDLKAPHEPTRESLQGRSVLDAATLALEARKERSTGTLELHVDIGQGPARVRRAHISGVAQGVAEKLTSMDLRAARVPMKIIVGMNEPDPATILRDEAGRLHVYGNLRRLARFVPEGTDLSSAEQAERPAREVVELALSRTLDAWHAPINTDDTAR